MRIKLSRVVVAAILATSLLIAGTAHAGYSQPGGERIVLSGAQ
jgi:hypothetical protein